MLKSKKGFLGVLIVIGLILAFAFALVYVIAPATMYVRTSGAHGATYEINQDTMTGEFTWTEDGYKRKTDEIGGAKYCSGKEPRSVHIPTKTITINGKERKDYAFTPQEGMMYAHYEVKLLGFLRPRHCFGLYVN